MAIAFVQSTHSGTTGGDATAFSLPSEVAAGNCLVLWSNGDFWNIPGGIGTGYESVYSNQPNTNFERVTLTARTWGDSDPHAETVQVWIAVDVPAGPHVITCYNGTGGADYSQLTLAEFSGVATVDAVTQSGTQSGTVTNNETIPVTVTLSPSLTSGELLIGMFGASTVYPSPYFVCDFQSPNSFTTLYIDFNSQQHAHPFTHCYMITEGVYDKSGFFGNIHAYQDNELLYGAALISLRPAGARVLAPGTYTEYVSTPGPFTFEVPDRVNFIARGACHGGGASGAKGNTRASGGGGGSYADVTDLAVTPGQMIYGNIGAGGVSRTTAATSGAAGGDTWFNKNANAAPSSTAVGVLAKGGVAGNQSTGTASAAAGGATASSIGINKWAGGNSGAASTTNGATSGGGGSGSVTNSGVNATAVTTNAAGAGSAARSGGGSGGTAPGGAGGSSVIGGGGGGGSNTSGVPGGAGGYPGGGGGAAGTTGAGSGPGGNGQVAFTFVVPPVGGFPSKGTLIT